MVSTKWFQGLKDAENFTSVRKSAMREEAGSGQTDVTDEYDAFAYNAVVYEDGKAVGCGRLLYADRRYKIDRLCVLKEYRRQHYGDLLVRMLIRRAVTIGAQDTYAQVPRDYATMFEKIGFDTAEDDGGRTLTMVKHGDVGGSCSCQEI